MTEPFIYYVTLDRSQLSGSDYALTIPAFGTLEKLELHPKVTYFIGENGTGKSTLLEAIAVLDGFNPEGGSRNFNFSTRDTHSQLWKCLRIGRGPHPERRSDGYFLRAETFYNVATEVEELAKQPGGQDFLNSSYGGKSLHVRSHGESFFTLFLNRFRGNGLYLLDEPESALSPKRQLSFLTRMHDLIESGSQFVIATHSPILMAYPDSVIYQFSANGIEPIDYEETDHYQITKMFLTRRESMLRQLMRHEES
ncbi:MAG: AAA family ATPase [Planctomycetaceae bacterium]